MIKFRVDNLKEMNACLKPFLDFLKNSDVSEDDMFASKLVSYELITNVLRHLGETADFTGSLNGDEIVISVSSPATSGDKLCVSLPDVFAESGRGLYIVRAISCGNVFCADGAVVVHIKRRQK